MRVEQRSAATDVTMDERGGGDRSRSSKYAMQDAQYAFPYHHIPHVDGNGVPRRTRGLHWGMEYLCYQLHALEMVHALAPRSVLEVGCGDGRFIGSLGTAVSTRVGVDLSESSIRFARAFYPEVQFHCCAAESLKESFDLVAAIEVLEHIPDDSVAGFIDSLGQRARSGGHVLISVPTKNVPLHPKHYRHYDESLLREHVALARVPLEFVTVEHVYAAPVLLEWLLKLTFNRFFVFEAPLLSKFIWRYIWKRARVAGPDRGRHLVALLKRK